MKKFFREFIEFAIKGNVMALAIGVIIGGAFQTVIHSLTDNIISPIIGLFVGMNFDVLTVVIFGVTLRYGAFITSVINFLILAMVVFVMTKGMSRLLEIGHKKESVAPPARKCPYCKTDIPEEATRCPHCTSEL